MVGVGDGRRGWKEFAGVEGRWCVSENQERKGKNREEGEEEKKVWRLGFERGRNWRKLQKFGREGTKMICIKVILNDTYHDA